MRTFGVGLLLAVAACTSQKPAEKPNFDPGRVSDTMVVDSGGASRTSDPLYQLASYTVRAAADSSTYTIGYRVSGFTTGDTVQVKLVRDSVAGKVTRVTITKNSLNPIGSVTFKVDKIYGTVANYTAFVRLRSTVVKNEISQTWKTNFAVAGKVDTMSVDSSLAMAVLKAAYASTDKKNVQFCLFVKTKDGKVRFIDSQQKLPLCQQEYKSFPVTQRFSDYRAFSTLDGYWAVHADSASNTVTIKFVRNALTNPLLGHST